MSESWGQALAFWIAAIVITAIVAFAALRRAKMIGGYRADPAVVVTTAGGTGFALAFILDQLKGVGSGSADFESLFGGGVTPLGVLLGLVFLILVAGLPVLAGFLPPDSDARPALLSGWLLSCLGWQVFNLPFDPFDAAALGMCLAWVLWLAALGGTAAMAFRTPAAPPVTKFPGGV